MFGFGMLHLTYTCHYPMSITAILGYFKDLYWFVGPPCRLPAHIDYLIVRGKLTGKMRVKCSISGYFLSYKIYDKEM